MHYIHLDDKTKNTVIRFILYGLLGIVIVLLTILLTLATQGYDIDRDTGKLYQNGLVLIQSSPSGSNIDLDGNMQTPRTPARLAMPEGQHKIVLSQEGYRNWNKNFELVGSEVLWFYYPLMVPKEIETSTLLQGRNIADVSQSIDKTDIVVLRQATNPTLIVFEADNLASEPVSITLPSGKFSRNAANGQLTIVEWAPDNRHIIISHMIDGKKEFLLVDTNNTDPVVNLSKSFDYNFENLAFSDNYLSYVTRKKDTVLQADLASTEIVPAIENGAYSYRVAKNGDIFALAQTKNTYSLLQFDGSNVLKLYESNKRLKSLNIGAGRDNNYISLIRGGNEVLVFEDLRYQESEVNVPDKVITLKDAKTNRFSEENDLLLAASNSNAITYELEKKKEWPIYQVNKLSLDTLRWVGTHHLSSTKDGRVEILDHDGFNRYQITDGLPSFGVFISKDLESIFTVGLSKANQNKLFQASDLIVE